MPSMFISDINIYLLLRYYSLTTSLSYKAISSVRVSRKMLLLHALPTAILRSLLWCHKILELVCLLVMAWNASLNKYECDIIGSLIQKKLLYKIVKLSKNNILVADICLYPKWTYSIGMYFCGTQVLLFKRRYNEGLIKFSNQWNCQ